MLLRNSSLPTLVPSPSKVHAQVPADQRPSGTSPAPAGAQPPWEGSGIDLESQAGPAGEAQRDLDAGAQRGPVMPHATQKSALGLDRRAGFLPLPTRTTR